MAIGFERSASRPAVLAQSTDRIQPMQRNSLRTFGQLMLRGGAHRPVAARQMDVAPVAPATFLEALRTSISQGPKVRIQAAAQATRQRNAGGR